ncbi:hypothetical protein ACF0H5_011777 [Mactra antiquata]
MADTTEKIQNMNIQDFDGNDFDPYSPHGNKMENVQNGDPSQGIDLLGGLSDQGQMNGTDKHVSFDQDAGIGLPDPSYMSQGQGQTSDISRHMSEGEILGYQNEYGEMSSHQGEYHGDSDGEYQGQGNLVNFDGTDLDQVQQGQGHINSGEYSSPERDSSQNDYDQYVENDYVEENPSGVQGEYVEDEAYDGGHENDNNDPDNWQPEMDPERLRRSLSPERSVSPRQLINNDSVSEMSQPQAVGGVSEASTIPISPDNTESADLVSQSSQMMSETESIDSRSECEGTPRRRRRIPKPKTKKPLELPPWDDNVVIPPLPRMKPTLIGKQADVPPMSPPPRLQRPRTAPARPKDASSDSGVEEDKSSLRKNSADSRKKYGTDSNNMRHKPGGGNVQIFHQRIDTKSVAPRTDTTKPRSALMSPRISPSKEKASTPKPPTPNTKAASSKIGSLNNVKHTPGGGNIKVLNAKVDFSNVSSKVGSKDKIHHQPKGGDKKILDQKVEVKAQSKVGSTANLKHKPGGGDKKIETQKLEFKETAKSKVGSMDKVKHKPGGGDIKILDEKVDFQGTAKPKVGSMDKVNHQPGGGDKKIETQKLTFKETAKARTDTGGAPGDKRKSQENSRSASVTSSQDGSVQD